MGSSWGQIKTFTFILYISVLSEIVMGMILLWGGVVDLIAIKYT